MKIFPLSISLKVSTAEDNGILLYNGDNDHIAVELYQGHVKVSYDPGSQPGHAIYRYGATLPLKSRLISDKQVCFRVSRPLSVSSASTETINDGQFHTVELVTFDQMVNLSIDGGLPTTMDSFGAVRPLNGEAPLYVGGRGPLQNTPPSSAGTLNYYTTVNHHPSPLALSSPQPNPALPSCNPPPHPSPTFTQILSSTRPTPYLSSLVTVFARCQKNISTRRSVLSKM